MCTATNISERNCNLFNSLCLNKTKIQKDSIDKHFQYYFNGFQKMNTINIKFS